MNVKRAEELQRDIAMCAVNLKIVRSNLADLEARQTAANADIHAEEVSRYESAMADWESRFNRLVDEFATLIGLPS